MTDQHANDDASNVEGDEQNVQTSTETVDVETLKKERDELANTNRQLFERAKKAEGFVKVDGKWVKAPKPEEAVATAHKLEATTGELSETQLDYLDLKGISEEADIEVIQRVMKRTGQTVRQALADDYVKAKLKENQDTRTVKQATPSSSRRSGQGAVDDLAFWLEKNERTNEMPQDFALRAKIVAAKEAKYGTNAPSWRR